MLVQEDKMEPGVVKIQERCSQRKQSNNNGTHSKKHEKNKKSQAENVHIRPKKPVIDVQSDRSKLLIQRYKV